MNRTNDVPEYDCKSGERFLREIKQLRDRRLSFGNELLPSNDYSSSQCLSYKPNLLAIKQIMVGQACTPPGQGNTLHRNSLTMSQRYWRRQVRFQIDPLGLGVGVGLLQRTLTLKSWLVFSGAVILVVTSQITATASESRVLIADQADIRVWAYNA